MTDQYINYCVHNRQMILDLKMTACIIEDSRDSNLCSRPFALPPTHFSEKQHELNNIRKRENAFC